MVPSGQRLELVSPAKINLSLAILGKQTDGFHALHSVVAQTRFGDALQVEWNPDICKPDQVVFSNINLPERENTVWQALQVFRNAIGMHRGQFKVNLEKRIPVGAGLGGGSSNAVNVLRAIRHIFGQSAAGLDWVAMAAEIGSDCPLFMEDSPVVMEGRGERISLLDESLVRRLRGQSVILFKPGFSISTKEAYARLAKDRIYQTPGLPENLMKKWKSSAEVLPSNCNDFERLLEDWIPSLAIILDRLRTKHKLDARLSGSGSACFLFPYGSVFAIKSLQDELASAWGRSYWIQETCIK